MHLCRRTPVLRLVILLAVPLLFTGRSFAWGHDGHTMINRVAIQTLPADTPAFLRSYAAVDALGFYGPVPDGQWRSYSVPDLNAAKSPDHFLNLEWADLAGPLPRKRYDFLRQLQRAQPAHPNVLLTPESVGLLPYAADEDYEALKIAMHAYRDLLAAKQDTRPIEAEILFEAGILGHFVGDGSQPLHVSMEYDGWTGPNPHGYSTDKHIHTRFESDFVHDNIKAADFADLVPEKAVVIQDVFPNFMIYLRRSNSLMEKVYQLDKQNAFTGAGTPQGKAFVEERLAAGSTKLRDLIYTAWIKSGDPVATYHGQ